MLFDWTKRPLLALVCGLCLSLPTSAIAQAAVETFSVDVPSAVSTRALGDALPQGSALMQSTPEAAATVPSTTAPAMSGTVLPDNPQSPAPLAAPPAGIGSGQGRRIALLLPLRSSTLGRAAEAVRAGFFAAYERDRDGIDVTLVETGDMPQDVVAGYRKASAGHDIVVGPLSRSGVAALARSGEVLRTTIALTASEAAQGPDMRLPSQMLVMGLSIEDEARQVADWARRDHAAGTAYVVHTGMAWQRRAARAFVSQWAGSGMTVKTAELDLVDGFLDGASLVALRERLDAAQPAFLFVALDAGQARQLRESVGRQLPMYGTSQLNPVALPDRQAAEPVVEMEGAFLLDIPWQLQADHPAVMAYPRQTLDLDQRRNADLERLYALGIDAFRVARELANQHTNFELDGVTGHLVVRFDRFGPYFERTAQQAVFRDGGVTPTAAAR